MYVCMYGICVYVCTYVRTSIAVPLLCWPHKLLNVSHSSSSIVQLQKFVGSSSTLIDLLPVSSGQIDMVCNVKIGPLDGMHACMHKKAS